MATNVRAMNGLKKPEISNNSNNSKIAWCINVQRKYVYLIVQHTHQPKRTGKTDYSRKQQLWMEERRQPFKQAMKKKEGKRIKCRKRYSWLFCMPINIERDQVHEDRPRQETVVECHFGVPSM